MSPAAAGIVAPPQSFRLSWSSATRSCLTARMAASPQTASPTSTPAGRRRSAPRRSPPRCRRDRLGTVEVRYDARAAKELRALDRPVARRIATAINALGTEPQPPGARQLVGYPGLWRVRVGDYRVVYAIRDAELVVLALIAHRSDVYRNL